MYKKYLVIVDGLTVGIMELSNLDILALSNDPDIQVKEV